jgi:hypothetical protein
MSGKNKNTVIEEPTQNENDHLPSKGKFSLKKLKKIRNEILKGKEKLEKKLKKLLSAEGKEEKAEKVNAKLEKFLKKEQKIFQDIRQKKEVREKQKIERAGEKAAKEIRKSEKEKAKALYASNEVINVDDNSKYADTSIQKKVSDNKKDILPSKKQPAKTSIKLVRRMTDLKQIDEFMKGEKRVTVVQAATSRKNRLIKSVK